MTRSTKLAVLALLIAGLAAAAAPWRVSRTTAAGAFAPGAWAGPEMRAAVTGPVTFKLLPRPRIQAGGLSVDGGDGALRIDAPLLKADLDIPSLLRGRWRMSAVTLVEPTVTLDVDRLPERPPGGTGAEASFAVRTRGGVIRLRSSSPFADQIATEVDASFRWDGDAVTASGAATWRGARARFSGDLRLSGRGVAPMPARFQIEGPLFSASADGLLSRADPVQFAGRASLATASLPRLFRAFDVGAPVPGVRRAQISGDLVAKPQDLSLSNVRMRLDGTRFEGTLGWRRDDGRGVVAGTLATDALDADALVGDALDGRNAASLYRRPLAASPLGTDIDLRVSATAARFGRVSVEDAAFAALVRGDRLELTVDGAQAYGGSVKGRGLATFGPRGVDAHVELSARKLDLASLSDGLTGAERFGGRLTGAVEIDGRGASLEEALAKSTGGGRVGVENGRLVGLSLVRALRRLGRRLPVEAERPGSPTTFDSARWEVSVKDGVLRIPDGKLTAPGVAMSFGAATSLPDGRIDVHAVAAEADGAGSPRRGVPTFPFDLSGFWAGPLRMTGRDGALPGLALPLIDGLSADR